MSIDHDDHMVHRRDVLCGGGAAVFGAMVAALSGGAKPVRAEGITGTVPEVDRVAVRVVVDSYQFAVAPSTKVGNVDIQHFGWGISEDKPPGKTLISEFGLSMHVESRRGAETRRVLVDFGYTPEALVNNIDLLGIDPAGLDALVLSHGHYDHFGGLVGFLQQHNSKLKAKLPIYVGGEECFCSREWTAPPVRQLRCPRPQGAGGSQPHRDLCRGAVARRRSRLHRRSNRADELRETSVIGVDHGIGCYADKFTEEERTKAIIPDQFRHEIATSLNLKGRGLVVLTSCSHRGVVNAVKQAQAVSGVRKVHAVIGGFHNAGERRSRDRSPARRQSSRAHSPPYTARDAFRVRNVGVAVIQMHLSATSPKRRSRWAA